MSQCNYCTFQWIKKNRPKGYKIKKILSDFGLGGIDVFIVPHNITVTDIKQWKKPSKQFPNGDENRQKYFVAWFMELPDFCCC